MIIVTGSAGFIGSGLIWELNNRGIHDILAVDELCDDNKWKNLRNLKFKDYMEKDDLQKYIEHNKLKVSLILHMGANSSTTEKDVSSLIRNNYEYTKFLALYALKNNVRFIYASSAATYGDGSQGYSDNESAMEKLQPLNPYGFSKQMFDMWAQRNGVLGKMAGLKYFNVYGPNEYHKKDMCSMIFKSFHQISAPGSSGKVRLFKSYKKEYGDGGQKRDFIYVKDAVNMTLFFMDNKQANGIFNIGTGKAETWNDLAANVFKAMEKPVNIEYIDMPDDIKGQYQYFTQADMSKLRNAGYKGKIGSLEEGISDYVKNYLIPGKNL